MLTQNEAQTYNKVPSSSPPPMTMTMKAQTRGDKAVQIEVINHE